MSSTRRWFQFSILDLLIVTTVAAIFAFLSQPLELKESGTTAFFGYWSDDKDPSDTYYKDHFRFDIWPDGKFSLQDRGHVVVGAQGCRLELIEARAGKLVLDYGHGDPIPVSALGGRITTLETSGYVLTKKEFWSGHYRNGLPHGTWITRDAKGNVIRYVEYRDGLVHDILTADGQPDVEELASWRRRKGIDRIADELTGGEP